MSFPAIMVTNTEESFLGLPSRVSENLCGRSVLEFTITRLASIPEIDKIILLHPEGQTPLDLIVNKPSIPIQTVAHPYPCDPTTKTWQSARKWALTAWRGGLGWTSVYDEALPARPIADAMAQNSITAALILRADWPLFDTQSASEMIATHEQAPESFRFCFTQSPPGLSAFVATQDTFQQLADNKASFGEILGYSHQHPALDPISRDANIAIPAAVRDCNRRFIYDTKRAAKIIDRIASSLGNSLLTATTEQIVQTVHEYEASHPEHNYEMLPQQISIELTTNRKLDGPLTVQHYLQINREPMTVEAATDLMNQIASDESDDVSITFTGTGDQLLHPNYRTLIESAHNAGVLGIAIETDLLLDNQQELFALNDLPLDLMLVSMNADTVDTYKRTMNSDQYQVPLKNLEHIFNNRIARSNEGNNQRIPWIIPTMIKTEHNLEDMETFFARWMTYANHAVIKPFQTYLGLLPDLSPVPMEPPHRKPCRQLGHRLTILSDGSILQCDQDITARKPLDNISSNTLLSSWQKQCDLYKAHQQSNFDCGLCSQCTEWFRP